MPGFVPGIVLFEVSFSQKKRKKESDMYMGKRILWLICVVMFGISVRPGISQTPNPYRFTCAGKAIPVVPFKHYHYVSFDMTEPVEVALACGRPIESFEISPRSRGIEGTEKNGEIRFTLTRPGYVMVRINDTERFFIFAEESGEIPTAIVDIVSMGVDNSGKTDVTEQVQRAMEVSAQQGKTLFFPAGTYLCRQLRPVSGTHLHLDRGAVVQAMNCSPENYMSDDNVKTRKFIYIKDADNVKITGRGIINGNGRSLRTTYGDQARMRLIMAVNSSNILMEGVMLQDPGSWNTQILKCRNVAIRNVKLMNDIGLSNTDGFDPDATCNLLIENCFAYCSDDNVAVKTTGYGGYIGDVDGITVRGCVFLTKKSSLKVGTETRGNVMRNIVFEDNDVLESDRGMALYVSDGAVFERIGYINNRFERNYPDAKQAGIHFVVNRRRPDSKLGKMTDVLVRDCSFEVPFPKHSAIKYPGPGTGIEVRIENLKIGGRRVLSLQEAEIEVQNASVSVR